MNERLGGALPQRLAKMVGFHGAERVRNGNPRLSAQRKITLIAQQVASMPRPEEIEASASAEGTPAQLVMQENESRHELQEVAF